MMAQPLALSRHHSLGTPIQPQEPAPTPTFTPPSTSTSSSPPTSSASTPETTPEPQPGPPTPASSPSPLSMARLIRTTHTEDGTSVFSSDASVPQISPFGPQGTSFTVFDTRSALPANNMEPSSSQTDDPLPRCPPKGALFCLADIPPGGAVPVHRTQTLDYCTVLSGEIVVGLDSGETKTVRAGDFIVQQGVNHEWVNSSQEACRILFVMLGADKIELQDGKSLEQTVF